MKFESVSLHVAILLIGRVTSLPNSDVSLWQSQYDPAAVPEDLKRFLPDTTVKPSIRATGTDPGLYAPTGYVRVEAYKDAQFYPGKLHALNEYLPWDKVKLPPKLPIHGLRISNKMPQLGVVLDIDSVGVPSGGTVWTFVTNLDISADDLATKKFKQAYEPTTPYSIETGVMAETAINCFMTMPDKLKLFILTLRDGTQKKVGILPMIGPYGNEPKFQCFNDVLKENFAFHGKAQWDESRAQTVSDFLASFHPETDSSKKSYVTWDNSEIDQFVHQADTRNPTFGNYDKGPMRLYNVFSVFPPKGKKCLVVGSAPHPWVEAILLSYGVTDITTSEYQVPFIPPSCKYADKMKTIHHEELLANPEQFDMIVSFSSLEHDGLGRYHDPMSPGGDLQQLCNLYELLKPGGVFVLEVPLGLTTDAAGAEQDKIRFPLDRNYGPVRYVELIKQFKLEGIYGVATTHCKGTEPEIGGCNKVQTLIASRKQELTQAPDYMFGVSVLRRAI